MMWMKRYCASDIARLAMGGFRAPFVLMITGCLGFRREFGVRSPKRA